MSHKSRGRNRAQAKVDQKPAVDKSPLVFQRDKIDFDLHIRERGDLTTRQGEVIDRIMDKQTQIVFLNGPAGTSKSYISILAGLRLLNQRSVSDIVYIRSIIESASKSLGSLPGDQNEKLHPFLMPLYEKLEELLPKAEIDHLIKQERAVGIPVNYLRGASINAKFIFCDEAQNLDYKELTTVITRLGKFSKLIIAGDSSQSDINGKSGFIKMFDLFNDPSSRDHGIHSLSFTKEDIVRSGVLKYIIERIEGAAPKPEPMFPAKTT